MPRSSASGIAAAVGGLLLLSSCGKDDVEMRGRPPAKGPLMVTIGCDIDTPPGITFSLTGAGGEQAWSFEARKGDAVEWKVSPNVTDIQIGSKSAVQLPLDDSNVHGQNGNSAKSKVKGTAAIGTYAYKIIATCQPSGTSKPPIKITIDPDMIIY